eukprot:scaffold10872_cov129-Isochrysis_galbana.AAC.4
MSGSGLAPAAMEALGEPSACCSCPASPYYDQGLSLVIVAGRYASAAATSSSAASLSTCNSILSCIMVQNSNTQAHNRRCTRHLRPHQRPDSSSGRHLKPTVSSPRPARSGVVWLIVDPP